MFNAREGQLFYAPHRGLWGVWKRGKTVNGCTDSSFVKDFVNKQDAKKFVYDSNGWNNNN